MKNYSIYFETLAQALQAHIDNVHLQGGVFAENAAEMYCFFGPVHYGQTAQDHRELASLKGKPTRKWAHASIYRIESGRYELTSYLA